MILQDIDIKNNEKKKISPPPSSIIKEICGVVIYYISVKIVMPLSLVIIKKTKFLKNKWQKKK